VTADDVIAFKLDAMNDLYDRDDEKFTTDTVNEFAALPQPFSFVGKSYMVDHEYKMANARGRIFDVGDRHEGHADSDRPSSSSRPSTRPRRPQYADFIEGLEFGINWAVSVGVVVDRSLCSICDSPVHTSSWGGWSWCSAGHEKGYYYVPGKEEEDGWGFFIPVDPSTKGAVKAMVDLHGAVDGYEISSVFLGAQYMAQLGEKSAVRKMFAAAEKAKLPILGLSAKEAEKIKMPHEPAEVQEARSKFGVVTENGVVKWTDEDGLVWAWDSNGTTDDILCLGKKKDAGDEDDDQSVKDADEDDDDSEEDDDTSEEDDDDESEDDDDSDDEDDDSERGRRRHHGRRRKVTRSHKRKLRSMPHNSGSLTHKRSRRCQQGHEEDHDQGGFCHGQERSERRARREAPEGDHGSTGHCAGFRLGDRSVGVLQDDQVASEEHPYAHSESGVGRQLHQGGDRRRRALVHSVAA
jgi:hypothetical protein